MQIQPDLALIQDESLRLAERVRWVHGNLYAPLYLAHLICSPRTRSLQNLPFANEQFDYIHITRVAFGLPENRVRVCLDYLVALWEPLN